MIQGFHDRETEKIFNREYSRKLPSSIQRAALRKLWILDAANDLQDLRAPPGNRLEALKGERRGQYSIRINNQWRVCFHWNKGNALEVEITDYH